MGSVEPSEEFDTSQPGIAGLDDDHFAAIVEAFLATGRRHRGVLRSAPSVLIRADEIVAFAVSWLEARD